MVTVLIDTNSDEAKKMLDFLKSTRYAKVLEDKEPNDETLQAIQDVESGKTRPYDSANQLINSLKSKAGV